MNHKNRTMNRDKETKPATMEELNELFESDHWKELNTLADEAEKQMERWNLVPIDHKAERYISDRYPIRALYARAELQDLATSYFDTTLSETEIMSVRDCFFDNYPDEIYERVFDAIETVIKERKSE